jgi:hypothetical protein
METQAQETAENPDAGSEAGTGFRSLALMRTLVVLGALVLGIGVLATFVKRVALDTPTWTSTSSQVLADKAVDNTLATYLTDQLYANTDVAGAIRSALPARAKPLAGPAAAGLRDFVQRAAAEALGSPRLQSVWTAANTRAHEQLVQLIDGGGSRLQTTNGDVVLDLRPLVEQIAGRAGVADRLGALPPDTGRIVLLHSSSLKTAQDGVKALRAVAYFAIFVVLLLFAAAVWVAPDRRKAVRAIAVSFLVVALVLIFVRRVLGDALINRLVHDVSYRPAASRVWWIATESLGLANATLLAVGVIGLVGAWLYGPSHRATAVRKAVAPWLSDPAIAFGVLAGVILLLLIWSPTPAAHNWVTAGILIALACIGLEVLRRKVVREFPDAERHPIWHWHHEESDESDGAPAGADDARLGRLEQLASLHERGILSDDEFAREKERLLAGRAATAGTARG